MSVSDTTDPHRRSIYYYYELGIDTSINNIYILYIYIIYYAEQ